VNRSTAARTPQVLEPHATQQAKEKSHSQREWLSVPGKFDFRPFNPDEALFVDEEHQTQAAQQFRRT
jgi:hypothetical protein